MNTFRTARRLAAAALLFGVAVGTTACDIDSLLEVTDRDRVTPSTLEDPAVIGVVIAGALGDFQDAWDSGDAYIAVSALMSDELYSSGTFTTRTATDRRNQFQPADGNTSDGAYNDLQFARRALKDATATVAGHEDFGPNSATFAELKALEGYTLVALGEGYCSAVPLSNIDESGAFVFGPSLTSAEILNEALARFDASLSASANNLAAVGKARVLIDLGQYSDAATAVAGVPMDFVYHIQHSEQGGQNAIFGLQGNGRYSLSGLIVGGVVTEAGTGQSGLAFVDGGAEYDSDGAVLVSAGDGRSPWFGPVGGFDAGIDQYITLLYNDVGDDTPLASGVEAWLIKAEAELQAGNTAGMTALLNELRANVVPLMEGLHDWPVDPATTLAPLPVPGSYNAAVDQLFQERGFWLLLSGHRLGDLRRQIYLPEYPADSHDDVYPTGEYHKGGSYGDDVVFPLDFDEINNTNEGFSFDQCVVESASIN